MHTKNAKSLLSSSRFLHSAGRVNGKNLINGYLHSLSAPNSVLKRLVSRTGLTFVSMFNATSIKVDVMQLCRARGFFNPA
jgi:hypothetical protein